MQPGAAEILRETLDLVDSSHVDADEREGGGGEEGVDEERRWRCRDLER